MIPLLPLVCSEPKVYSPVFPRFDHDWASLASLQHLKEQAGRQRNALAQLAASTSLHLEPGVTCALVPRPWLAAWRAFLGASGRRGSGAEAGQPPPPLPRVMADTFCTCHPSDDQCPALLCVQPPTVVKRCALELSLIVFPTTFLSPTKCHCKLHYFYVVESSLRMTLRRH